MMLMIFSFLVSMAAAQGPGRPGGQVYDYPYPRPDGASISARRSVQTDDYVIGRFHLNYDKASNQWIADFFINDYKAPISSKVRGLSRLNTELNKGYLCRSEQEASDLTQLELAVGRIYRPADPQTLENIEYNERAHQNQYTEKMNLCSRATREKYEACWTEVTEWSHQDWDRLVSERQAFEKANPIQFDLQKTVVCEKSFDRTEDREKKPKLIDLTPPATEHDVISTHSLTEMVKAEFDTASGKWKFNGLEFHPDLIVDITEYQGGRTLNPKKTYSCYTRNDGKFRTVDIVVPNKKERRYKKLRRYLYLEGTALCDAERTQQPSYKNPLPTKQRVPQAP